MRLRRLAPLLLLPLLASCSSGGGEQLAPLDALAQAKQRLASTAGVHVVLDATGLPAAGRSLEHAEGDAVPPGSFQGSARVRSASLAATVKVIAVAGALYVQQPFSSSYGKVDAASVGIPDPGHLLAADGLPAVLTSDPDARADGKVRVGSEVLARYRLTAPDAGPLSTVSAATGIATEADLTTDTHELRRLILVGPLFAAGSSTTLTITFTRYGQKTEIRAP